MLGRFGNEAKFIEHHACISDGSSCRAYYKLQFDVVYESTVSKTSLPLVSEHNITTTQQLAVCRVERQSFVLMNM